MYTLCGRVGQHLIAVDPTDHFAEQSSEQTNTIGIYHNQPYQLCSPPTSTLQGTVSHTILNATQQQSLQHSLPTRLQTQVNMSQVSADSLLQTVQQIQLTVVAYCTQPRPAATNHMSTAKTYSPQSLPIAKVYSPQPTVSDFCPQSMPSAHSQHPQSPVNVCASSTLGRKAQVEVIG